MLKIIVGIGSLILITMLLVSSIFPEAIDINVNVLVLIVLVTAGFSMLVVALKKALEKVDESKEDINN